MLSHPHRKMRFLCFTFCPFPLVLLQGTTGSSLMLSSSFPLSSSMCLLFTLPSALNSTTISSLLAAMAAFDLHMPNKPLIVSMKSSTASFLIDSLSEEEVIISALQEAPELLEFLCAVLPGCVRVSGATKTRACKCEAVPVCL